MNMFAFPIRCDSQWLMCGAIGHNKKKNHKNLTIGTNNELPIAKTPEIVSEQRFFQHAWVT